MANWGYEKEDDLYREAVEEGEDAFEKYMTERSQDEDFDWDEWDRSVRDPEDDEEA